MKLKITSDGTLHGTWITNAQTGEPLELVQAVCWSLDTAATERITGLATAVLTVRQVQLEVSGDARIERVALAAEEELRNDAADHIQR